jgi:hypothetical protein
MTRSAFRKWFWVHKWASLICTAFLLVICVTGLPLIFGEEIEHLLDTDPPYVSLPANTPNANLDEIVAKSRQMYPGEIIVSTFMDDDEPKIVVTMARSLSRVRQRSDHAFWIFPNLALACRSCSADGVRLVVGAARPGWHLVGAVVGRARGAAARDRGGVAEAPTAGSFRTAVNVSVQSGSRMISQCAPASAAGACGRRIRSTLAAERLPVSELS